MTDKIQMPLPPHSHQMQHAAPPVYRGPHAASGGMRGGAHEGMRPAIRGRNGEILTRNNRSNQQADQFEVPRALWDAGWDFQWNRVSCLGKPDPANMNAMHENGWRPVPSQRLPGYYHPVGYAGAIERDGLVLCERPKVMSDQAVKDGIDAAKAQRQRQSASFAGVSKMLEESGGAASGYAAPDALHDHRGYARPKLNRSVEGVPPHMYPQRELALGTED